MRTLVRVPRPTQIPYPDGIVPTHIGGIADGLSLRVTGRFGRSGGPETDESVWAIIDDGCNTKLMPKRWLDSAQTRLAASQENKDQDSDEDIN